MSETVQCPHTTNLRRMAHEQRRSNASVPHNADEEVLKPAASARFSNITAQIVKLSTSELPTIGKHVFVKSPWRRLELDLSNHMTTVARQVMHDSSNQHTLDDLRDIQEQRKKHDPTLFTNPRRSVTGGIDTHARASVKIVQDMYKKTPELHGTTGYIDLLNTSYKPLFKIAEGNPVQLIAFNDDVLPNNRLPELIQTDHGFNYETSVMDIRLTHATRKAILFASPPQPDAQTIGELTSPYSPTLGCPIILNPEDVVTLWQYSVAATADRGLLE